MDMLRIFLRGTVTGMVEAGVLSWLISSRPDKQAYEPESAEEN